MSFFLDLCAAGVFLLIGYFAKKGSKASYIIGIALYAVDALILLGFQAWLGVAFHAYALFQIWGGFSALKVLTESQVSGTSISPSTES